MKADSQEIVSQVDKVTALQTIDRIDDNIDKWWDRHLRGKPLLDRLFYTASESANNSMIWYVLGSIQAATRRNPRDAVEFCIVLALEWLLVNGGVKTLFMRNRPDSTGQRPYPLRQPVTSSFPSSHASSAMVAASLMSYKSRWSPAWYTLGLIVAASRIHTRTHYASDVAAGIGLGMIIGRIVRRLLR